MYLGTDTEHALRIFAMWLQHQKDMETEQWNNMQFSELAQYFIEHQREIE